ncbi:hypothetical protein BG005_001123, partial [Podila minutissima]
MQKTWLQEGLRNKFFKLPKPRHLRETHFCEDDPLLGVTKAMLLQQVAAGKYVLSELPPLVSLPWFGVPKPNLTVRPIIDARYVNKYMISPKFSLPPMPKLVRNVLSCYKFARKYDITNGFDHLPRHKDSQTYFGIKIDGKLYTSTCILMDETCAPWAFQIWLHDMYKSFLREEGLSFTPIRSNTLTLHLLQELRAKKALLPSKLWQQAVGFLGWARCASPCILVLLAPAIELCQVWHPHVLSELLPYDELLDFFSKNDPIPWSRTTAKPTIITDATFACGGTISAAGATMLPVPIKFRSSIFLAKLWMASSTLIMHTRRNDCGKQLGKVWATCIGWNAAVDVELVAVLGKAGTGH